jgi:hypothetical protein
MVTLAPPTCLRGGVSRPLLPHGEKVPEGRMRGDTPAADAVVVGEESRSKGFYPVKRRIASRLARAVRSRFSWLPPPRTGEHIS